MRVPPLLPTLQDDAERCPLVLVGFGPTRTRGREAVVLFCALDRAGTFLAPSREAPAAYTQLRPMSVSPSSSRSPRFGIPMR
jgi:hypothetical protein